MSTRCNIEFYDETQAEQGQPSAMIYQHCDGYPNTENGILALLKRLESILHIGSPGYGRRTTDPMWAAAEFVSQFRQKMGGHIYVAMQHNADIAYLYRVICGDKWTVKVFEPEEVAGITTFKEIDPAKAA